jgi:hypothetical protein
MQWRALIQAPTANYLVPAGGHFCRRCALPVNTEPGMCTSNEENLPWNFSDGAEVVERVRVVEGPSSPTPPPTDVRRFFPFQPASPFIEQIDVLLIFFRV